MIQAVRKTIRDALARRLELPSIDSSLDRLKRNGFSPKHIFDVGAYQGDFAASCLQLWPTALVTCFEVLPAPAGRLKKRLGDRVELIPCLLGAENQNEVELNMAETASSVLIESAKPQTNKSSFPMRTIDDVVEQKLAGNGPDFLKMDVQGYELEVLKGASQCLQTVDAILAEINFLDLHDNVPLLADIVTWLSTRGWVAYDISGITRRPLDRALWQADFIFVPETSRLRHDKRYE